MTTAHRRVPRSATCWDTWRVTGTVIRGDGRGRHLGVPTANVDPDRAWDDAADGVYAGLALLGGDPRTHAAAISVGTNPTFRASRRTVEAHLLDFSGDLYGRRVELRSVLRLRGMTAFGSVVELLAAMDRDIAETRRLLQGRPADRDTSWGAPGAAVP